LKENIKFRMSRRRLNELLQLLTTENDDPSASSSESSSSSSSTLSSSLRSELLHLQVRQHEADLTNALSSQEIIEQSSCLLRGMDQRWRILLSHQQREEASRRCRQSHDDYMTLFHGWLEIHRQEDLIRRLEDLKASCEPPFSCSLSSVQTSPHPSSLLLSLSLEKITELQSEVESYLSDSDHVQRSYYLQFLTELRRRYTVASEQTELADEIESCVGGREMCA
jgi:hypothetical protein